MLHPVPWLLLVTAFGPRAFAAPGDVDPGFNPGVQGYQSVWLEPIVRGIAMQPDEKIIFGGFFQTVGGMAGTNLARLNPNGTVDTSLNSNPVPYLPGLANDVFSTAVQADGKIVIAGRSGIFRLNADGTRDTGFNPNLENVVYSMAVQPDGKIVIGWKSNTSTVNWVTHDHIARLNVDGTLDPGFNCAVSNEGVNDISFVYCMAVQPDGKIVVGGRFTAVGGVARKYLARLNPDGTLDIGFDPNVNGDVFSTAVQADGKIVIGGGFTKAGNTVKDGLARLNPDGTLDIGFAPVGLPSNSGLGYFFCTALQTDGKIVIGRGTNVVRLNADGTSDPGFKSAVTAVWLPLGSLLFSTAIQADGKIVVGGTFDFVAGIGRTRLARLENDAATQSLTVASTNRVEWLRGGASPEAQYVTFELSTDGGTNWTALGMGGRIPGGWELTGLPLPR